MTRDDHAYLLAQCAAFDAHLDHARRHGLSVSEAACERSLQMRARLRVLEREMAKGREEKR